MAELRIGTCSWKYPSWRGLVYSASPERTGRAASSYLGEYARHYDTVEVDQWFWSLFGTVDGAHDVRLPEPADVESYRASVSDRFRFSVKGPNSLTLTHFYRKDKGEPLRPNPHFLSPSLFQAFLSRLEPLHDVLGPLMFQFGYLNREMVASQEQFQARLAAFARQLPSGYQYGVEIRNSGYLNEAYFALLRDHNLSPVFVRGYWMPPIVSVYEHWRALIQEQDLVVMRLHGPDRKGIEARTGKKWDRLVESRDDELAAVSEMVQDLLDSGVSVYVNVNNHYEGSAPLTIDRLRRLLGQEPMHHQSDLGEGYVQASLDLPGTEDSGG